MNSEKNEELEEEAIELDEFEVLAEWTLRRLRKPSEEPMETYPKRVLQWALYSLGLEEKTQDIYFYIREREGVTTTEVAEQFNISINTARRHLDQLHTLGLVDYMGREYRPTYDSVAKAIDTMLLPRITDLLRTISRIASTIERAPIERTPLALKDNVEKIQAEIYKVLERLREIKPEDGALKPPGLIGGLQEMMAQMDTQMAQLGTQMNELFGYSRSSEGESVKVVQHVPSIVITGDNLRQLEEKLVIQHVNSVEFTHDVTKEDIENHVKLIRHVKTLTVPEGAFPGFLGKITHVTEVKRY